MVYVALQVLLCPAYSTEVEELQNQLHDITKENHELRDQIAKYKEELESNSQKFYHPCIDPSHPKFAPELELAIKVWEKKYLDDYPTNYEDHSPAIEQILNEMEVKNRRLIQRITVITNNKKLKIS